MDIYHIIKRPLVTEKGTHQSQTKQDTSKTRPARGGAYSFEVAQEASKADIRNAVEKIYGVRVIDVRTCNRKGKSRRYRYTVGATSGWKKATVVLNPDYHIDLF